MIFSIAPTSRRRRVSVNTHREYVVDRNIKIDRMFARLRDEGGKLVDQFRADPRSFAAQYGIEFDDEEVFAARTLADGSNGLISLWERLRTARLAFFDNNCGCGGGPHSVVV